MFGPRVLGAGCEAEGAGPHAAREHSGRGRRAPGCAGWGAAAASARVRGGVRRDEALLRLRGSAGAPRPSAGWGGEPRPRRPLGPAQGCGLPGRKLAARFGPGPSETARAGLELPEGSAPHGRDREWREAASVLRGLTGCPGSSCPPQGQGGRGWGRWRSCSRGSLSPPARSL